MSDVIVTQADRWAKSLTRHAEQVRLEGYCQGVADERERRMAHVRRLEAALRVARGWVINGTESAQARRDLVTVDEALAIRNGDA